MNRPIPAFYCCYLLRSTVRHSCVYVGSTPNPARRLNQHNGVKKGGAAKTSRQHLRPWEMTCIVSGFPSHIAVLQFEWAWQNPHITLHIPSELRIQHATSKKRSGHPKRPKLSVTSLLSNLHLLLRVPSFKRWPLELCFFSQDVYKSWMKLCETSVDLLPEHLSVKTDFPLNDSSAVYNGLEVTKKNSSDHLERLVIDYSNQKSQIEKAKTIIDFEQEKSCSVCKIDLEHGQGIYTICSSPNCKAVTHITCLGRYFQQNDQGSILPVQGLCPVCNSETRWIDVMKELSLRMRGEKELKSLLKVKKIRASRKASQASSHSLTESSEDSDDKLSDGLKSLPKAKKKRASRKASQASSQATTESSEDSDDELNDGSTSLPKAKKKRASRKASQASSHSLTESSEDSDDKLSDGLKSLPKAKKKRASRKASQASSQATTESSEDPDDELNDGSTSLPKVKKKRANRKASQATIELSEDPDNELTDGSTSLPKAKKKRVSKKASQVTTESAEGPEDLDETNNKNDANSLMSIDNLDGSDTSSLMDCIDISRFPSPTKDNY